MRIATLAGILLVVTPLSARARCLAVCQCSQPSPWVVVGGEAQVVTTDAGRVSLVRVERVFGAADSGAPAVGSLSEDGWEHGVWGRAGGYAFVTDGGVTCGNVHLPLEEYAAMVQAGTCEDGLALRGYREPPCNDVRFCGCSSVGPLVAVLGVLALARRRTSRR